MNKVRVSVVLISDRPEQMTGSGCCGKVEGDSSITGAERYFEEACQIREEMGLLHRTVRRLYSEEVEQGMITIVQVDPRNQLYLMPKLWRDVFRYRPGWKAGLRSMFQFFSLPAVIVNGRAIHRRGQLVTPDELSHAIAECLGERSQRSKQKTHDDVVG